MNRQRPLFIASALLVVVSLGPSVVNGRLYRWVDQNGEVYYSDRVPPAYSQRQREVFNDKGDFLSTVRAPKTQAELARAAREAEIEARRLESEQAQQRRDRVLLETFGSVAELGIARDERIAIVDSHMRLIEGKIRKLGERWSELGARVKVLRQNGKPIVPRLAGEVDRLRKAIKSEQRRLQAKRQEREQIQTRFESDIERFLKLNRMRTSNTNP